MQYRASNPIWLQIGQFWVLYPQFCAHKCMATYKALSRPFSNNEEHMVLLWDPYLELWDSTVPNHPLVITCHWSFAIYCLARQKTWALLIETINWKVPFLTFWWCIEATTWWSVQKLALWVLYHVHLGLETLCTSDVANILFIDLIWAQDSISRYRDSARLL